MSKVAVTEGESDKPIVDSWYERAKNVGPHDSLDDFVRSIVSKYDFDYGTCVHAMTAVAIAAMSKMGKGLGITGFQHGCVMHELLHREFGLGRIIGHRVQDLDNILYPVYCESFSSLSITADTAERIKNAAIAKMKEDEQTSGPRACYNVFEHWKKLSVGWLPNGIVIGNNAAANGF